MLLWLASVAFALPDLRISRIEESAHGVWVFVENVGDEDSRGFYVDLWLQAQYAPVVGDFGDYWAWCPGVRAGGRYDVLLPVPLSMMGRNWPGGWVDAIVDTDQVVSEWHEGNNVVSALTDNLWVFVGFDADGNINWIHPG